MNTVDFQKFLVRAERYAAGCWDAKARVEAMEYGDGQLTFPATSEYEELFISAGDGERRVTLPLNGRAYQQFVGRMEGPSVRWLKNACPPSLEKKILRRMMKEHHGDTLLLRNRTQGEGVIRAVLSADYTRFDHLRFLRVVRDVLSQTTGNVRVWKGYVGDRMGAFLLFPDQTPLTLRDHEHPDNGGDGGLRPAIYIRNSEVGDLGAHITAGVFRLVCTNGLIAWDGRESLVVTHRFKSANEITIKIAQHLAAAMNIAEEQIDVLHRAAEVAIADLAATLAGWGDRYRLSNKQQATWHHSTLREAEPYGRGEADQSVTLADAVNGLTLASHFEEDPEAEAELQIIAGKLLSSAIRA